MYRACRSRGAQSPLAKGLILPGAPETPAAMPPARVPKPVQPPPHRCLQPQTASKKRHLSSKVSTSKPAMCTETPSPPQSLSDAPPKSARDSQEGHKNKNKIKKQSGIRQPPPRQPPAPWVSALEMRCRALPRGEEEGAKPTLHGGTCSQSSPGGRRDPRSGGWARLPEGDSLALAPRLLQFARRPSQPKNRF